MTAAANDVLNLFSTPNMPGGAHQLLTVNAVVYYKGGLLADVNGTAVKVTGTSGLKIRGWCADTGFTADTSDPALVRVTCANGQLALEVSESAPPTIADHLEIMYAEDDRTVARTSAGGTLSPVGRLMRLETIGGRTMAICEVGMLKTDIVDLVSTYATYTTLASTADAEGASLIGIEDDGSFTSQTNVEEALQEIYQNIKSVQAQVNIPLSSFFVVSTGAPGVAFNDGVADGFDYLEGMAYRFNVGSTAAIGATIPMPQDLDDAADIVLHILASRVGSLDTTAALTVAAYFQTVGAAYDADTDAAAGDTGAIAGATKVVSELTKTILATDVPAAPCALSISLVPTAALDADDMRVHAVWIEYKRKVLTS